MEAEPKFEGAGLQQGHTFELLLVPGGSLVLQVLGGVDREVRVDKLVWLCQKIGIVDYLIVGGTRVRLVAARVTPGDIEQEPFSVELDYVPGMVAFDKFLAVLVAVPFGVADDPFGLQPHVLAAFYEKLGETIADGGLVT